jgi:histidinol dehydrogenase
MHRTGVLGNPGGLAGKWRSFHFGAAHRKNDGLTMQLLRWNNLDEAGKAAVLRRSDPLSDASISQTVTAILEAVRTEGDIALARFTRKFDGVDVTQMQVPVSQLKAAWDEMPGGVKAALKLAKSNIEAFHRAQLPAAICVETMPGVVCRRVPRALESAGLYVPGGSAPLVSTLLMLAIPAKIAGVPKRVVVTPPGKDGSVDPVILAAAFLCDIEELYMVGGAQAIAALGFGTKTLPKCAKIFGPGNMYVAQAKAQIAMEMGGPAIDLPAGPSEVLVLADEDANPAFVAADLLSQAEHDPLAQVLCFCTSEPFAKRVLAQIDGQVANLPRRQIAQAALQNGRILVVPEKAKMIELANRYAPEHLIVQLSEPEQVLHQVRNAGSVFLGPWAPESVGDYASGTNHTLPTFGAARAWSGVGVESFLKFISVQSLSREGLVSLGPCVEKLATLEGLDAHKRAVSIRLAQGEV